MLLLAAREPVRAPAVRARSGRAPRRAGARRTRRACAARAGTARRPAPRRRARRPATARGTPGSPRRDDHPAAGREPGRERAVGDPDARVVDALRAHRAPSTCATSAVVTAEVARRPAGGEREHPGPVDHQARGESPPPRAPRARTSARRAAGSTSTIVIPGHAGLGLAPAEPGARPPPPALRATPRAPGRARAPRPARRPARSPRRRAATTGQSGHHRLKRPARHATWSRQPARAGRATVCTPGAHAPALDPQPQRRVPRARPRPELQPRPRTALGPEPQRAPRPARPRRATSYHHQHGAPLPRPCDQPVRVAGAQTRGARRP